MKRIKFIFLLLAIMNGFPVPAQELPLEITIAWDASLSMQNRDFALDREYLQRYFTSHPNTMVTLLLFSNTVWSKEQFRVESGKWETLENRLKLVRYDGATFYPDLPGYCQGSEILLFTDGHQNMATATPVFNGSLITVNSSRSYDQANLNLLSIINDGELQNLQGRQTGIAADTIINLQRYFGKIYGTYTDLEGVRIRIAGDNASETKPTAEGTYSIDAIPGDTLEFTANGRQSARRTLGEYSNIDVWLEDSGGIRLDEVVVSEKLQEPKKDVITALGKKAEDGVGYAVESIDDKAIDNVNTTAASATQGKFSGVQLGQNDDLSQVQIRPKTSILSNNYGLIVLDGVPMPKSNSSFYNIGSPIQNTDFIDPKNIASITVLKSLAATNRYGSMGANGAILITTKTATFAGPTKIKDLALRTDNVYEGKISVSNKSLTTPYLKELKEGKNVAEAYEIYLEQRERYKDQPAYYVDLSEYFREASPVLSMRILSNILEMERPSLIELKSLLYKAKELGLAPLQLQTANRIMEDYPGSIQSYLDFALAQRDAGNYQAALNMLLAMQQGTANENLDFTGLGKTIGRELRNLLSQQQAVLDLGKVPAEFKNNIRFNARLIFEWSKPDAQFSLQFVNPQKRFFTWDHTALADSRRIRDETEQGYSLEEFEIFGEGVAGNWIINVMYEGNMIATDTTPVFLHCRTEKNFGKPGQTAEDFVVRLHEPGSTIQIGQLKIE